jgi:hypothetical protein
MEPEISLPCSQNPYPEARESTLVEEGVPFENTYTSGKNKFMVMGLDRALFGE